VNTRCFSRWRILECSRVVELAPEVETAEEAENFAQRRSLVTPHSLRDYEFGAWIEQQGSPFAATARR